MVATIALYSPKPTGCGHMSKSSLALSNLRAFVILLVVAFHSVLAYLGSQPASPAPFDSPPYHWRAIPILDSERWFGFDLFCASQYVYLMHLMFFLSGMFVWSSLRRKGAKAFLSNRFLRLADLGCGRFWCLPALDRTHHFDNAGMGHGTAGAGNLGRFRSGAVVRSNLICSCRSVHSLCNAAGAGIRQPRGECIWHISRPLRVRHLAAVHDAFVCTPCHYQGRQRICRYSCPELDFDRGHVSPPNGRARPWEGARSCQSAVAYRNNLQLRPIEPTIPTSFRSA